MMLRKEPLLRPSVEEILEHPWVRGHYKRDRKETLKARRRRCFTSQTNLHHLLYQKL